MLVLLLALSIVCFLLYVVYKPPKCLIRYFQRRWRDVLWEIPTKKKLVALTIDDAPSEHTEEILGILRANESTATFFIIGSHVPGREGVLQKLVQSGNELGNHAMYDEPSRSLSDSILRKQLCAVQKTINDVYTKAGIGNEPPGKYFRPGSGFFSTRIRKAARELGFRIVLGSVYPHDPQIPSWRINARHVLSMLRPGAIVICHDGRGWTVPMLRRVVLESRRRGYQIVTVTELLKG